MLPAVCLTGLVDLSLSLSLSIFLLLKEKKGMGYTQCRRMKKIEDVRRRGATAVKRKEDTSLVWGKGLLDYFLLINSNHKKLTMTCLTVSDAML